LPADTAFFIAGLFAIRVAAAGVALRVAAFFGAAFFTAAFFGAAFLTAAFFGAAFVTAALFGAAFLTVAFFGATFFTAAFFGAAFFTDVFFGAAFLTATFFGAAFFAAAFFGAAFFTAAFFGAAFFTATFFTAAFFGAAFLAAVAFDAFFAAGRAAVRLTGVLMPAFLWAALFLAAPVPEAAFFAVDFFAADLRVVAMRHHSCGWSMQPCPRRHAPRTQRKDLHLQYCARILRCHARLPHEAPAIQDAGGPRSSSTCRSSPPNASRAAARFRHSTQQPPAPSRCKGYRLATSLRTRRDTAVPACTIRPGRRGANPGPRMRRPT
jgi:hypothetical protein